MFWVLTLLAIIPGIVYASFFEWVLHRYLMHQPLWGLTYPFETHARVHHVRFKADYTYHLQKEEDKETIPMAWWNGPLLVLIAATPTIAVSWPLHWWWLSLGFVTASALYYGAYEYLHWCMHLPKSRRLEFGSAFRWVNGHHLLHHRWPTTNFNVVLPLADWILGTLLSRAKFPFMQARGPSVPDVQPKNEPSVRG
ncbi:MAG: sterol desaturase family protein [Candidatus Taylorbacteria bacterium]|nr:sterol desaturase family protein [Candidatus Taylorbacteria bacterium]